jgi:hypothetical protein
VKDTVLILEQEGSIEPKALAWTSIDPETQARIMNLTDAFMRREINPLLREASIRPFYREQTPYARPAEKGVSLNLRVPVEVMDVIDAMVYDGKYESR